MSNTSHEHGIVQPILGAIGSWVKEYRRAVGLRGELANFREQEVAFIANDIGVPPGTAICCEQGAARRGRAAETSQCLGVDPQKLSSTDPALMRSLQRICITCGHKDHCQHNLAAGTAAGHYRYYCPNAVSLDALFRRNDSAVAAVSSPLH